MDKIQSGIKFRAMKYGKLKALSKTRDCFEAVAFDSFSVTSPQQNIVAIWHIPIKSNPMDTLMRTKKN